MYPALAVLQKLTSSGESLGQDKNTSSIPSGHFDILWVGGEGGMEVELVKRAKVPLITIPAAGLHGVGMRTLSGNLLRIGRGVLAARHVLKKFRPDVIFYTGGYVGIPVVFATRLMRFDYKRPAILAYVPDIEPGLALKTAGRFADHIAVTVEDSRDYFPPNNKITVTGYPTRDYLLGWDRNLACQKLGLSPGLLTLLVLGGSRGARSINRAVMAALPELLEEMQVVHISGALDWSDVKHAKTERLTPAQADRYHVYPYIHSEMGAALSVADLVVSRAGASTLGELPLFSLPALLVPYPYAWHYQSVNAQYLADRGAAIVLPDEDLAEKLLPMVQDIMRDRDKRHAMGAAMHTLSHPTAADTIGNLLRNLAGSNRQDKD